MYLYDMYITVVKIQHSTPVAGPDMSAWADAVILPYDAGKWEMVPIAILGWYDEVMETPMDYANRVDHVVKMA